jgi:hypothetical protein
VPSYEILTLLISLLAAVIATVALVRGNTVAKRQLELQEKQANFAELQHKLLVLEQSSRVCADLRGAFIKDGRGHKSVLRNVGAAAARQVRIAGHDGISEPESLIKSRVHELFPIAELRSNEVITVIAAIHLGTKLPAQFLLTWDDDSGNGRQRELKVQIEDGI